MLQDETLDFEKMIQQSLGAHAVFAKNTIVFCNRGFESIAGYSHREMTLMAHKGLSVLFKGGDGDLLGRLVRLCQKGEQVSYHPEVRLTTKKGDSRWIEIALSPIGYQGKPAAHLSCVDKTENKKRYDAVSGMAQTHWEMLKAAKILSVMLDPDGMVIFCNDSMLDAIGWKREEILGRNWFDSCVAGHETKRLYRGYLGREEGPFYDEYDVMTKDGGRRTLLMSSTLVRDGSGIISGVISVGEDRTELKRVETELREHQGKFASVIDHTDDGISVVDEEGAVIAWNRGIERICGIYRNEALGRPFWEVLCRTACDESKSPESNERAKLFIEEFLMNGESKERRSVVDTIQRPDGTRKKVRRTLSAIRTARGFRIGVVMRDVTEAIGLQESLQSCERKYRLLAESIPGMLFIVSRAQIVLYVNGNGASFLSKSADAIIGQKLRDLFPPHSVVAQESMLAQVFESGGEMIREILLHDRWLSTRFVPHKDQSGIVSAVLVVADDITRRKYSEQQLWDAKERAEAAVKEKNDCIAGMSDAVMAPVYGIAGMADLLLTTTELDKTQREFASAIERSSRTLLHSIDEIFDLSKIESGKLSLEFAPFDLHETVRDVVETLTPLALAKQVGLSLRYAKKLPRSFNGDGGRIRQVLLNLVGTSMRFAGRGHVTIDVDGGELPGNAYGVKLRVRDTGIGISPEEQRALFEKTARFDCMPGRSDRRWGLGLSISKQLVAMMNGTIGVENSAGAGSTFTVSLNLPAAPGKSLEGMREPAAELAHERAPVGTRVLVIDGDDISRQVACSLLRHCGCSVEAASAGHEVIDTIKSSHFDIIFIDCQMQGSDGYETARRVRRLKGRYLNVIFVAMVAQTTRDERKKHVEAGIDDAISKPLSLRAVREVLRRHFTPLHRGLPGAPGEKRLPSAVFSVAKINSITGGDPAAVRKLVELNLKTYPMMVQHLDELIAVNNFNEAASIAQGITASAGLIGALRVAETAAAIAMAARKSQADTCKKIAAQLRKENEKLLQALREMKT